MSNIRKKIEFNRKYLAIATYAFIVIALSIILEKILGNPQEVSQKASTIGKSFGALVSPFGYGFLMAYLTNPLMMFLENKIFAKFSFFKNRFKVRRGVSILAAYVIYVVLITVIIVILVPELSSSAEGFFANFTNNYNNLIETIVVTVSDTGLIAEEKMREALSGYAISLEDIVLNFSSILQTVMTVTIDVVSVTINVILGIFISFYLLASKEKFLRQLTKIMYAVLKEGAASRIIKVVNRVNIMFDKFVLAKVIDSLIIGVLAYVGLSIMKMPFAMLIGVIIGITNIIPYFGPFIGAIPSILIILFTVPSKTLLIAVFILALQQFDGNFLGPKLLGDSIGINPVWVIFAIIVGGAIGGPVGMFLGVPIFAALKTFFDEYVDKKYQDKFVNNPSLADGTAALTPKVSLVNEDSPAFFE